tara:strand:+ start:1 stop:1596 length:1596 start_codon:yes stop_codon:yes gene_type:complete
MIDQAGARMPMPTEQERAGVAAGMPPGDTGLPVSAYQQTVQQELGRRANAQAMPPQQMAAGGVVRMANEGRVPYRPSGSTFEEVASSIYNYSQPMIQSGSGAMDATRPSITVPDPSFPTRAEFARSIFGEEFSSPSMTSSFAPLNRLSGGSEKYFMDTVLNNDTYREKLSEFLPKEELTSIDGMSSATLEDVGKVDPVSLGSSLGENQDFLRAILEAKTPENKVEEDLTKSTFIPASVDTGIETDDSSVTGEESDLYAGLRQRLSGVTFPTDKPDYSDAKTEFSTAIESARAKIGALPMDFSGFASDYAGLISEQERRAKKIREDAQKDIGSQALIQLGAGIMEGDTAGGLTRAAKSVADLKKQARQEAREEEAIARKMQIAQKEQRGELGIKGMQAERERQLALASLDEAEAKSLSSIAKSAADAKYAASVEEYKANIDSIVEEAKLIRYRDLQDEERAANYRAVLASVDATLKVLVEEYYRNNPDATAEELGDYSISIMDQLVSSQGAANPYPERTKNRTVDFPSVAGG